MDPSFKSLPFISTDYRAEVHENIKQLAIALVRSSKVASSDKSSDQAVGTGIDSGTSGSGPACKINMRRLGVLFGTNVQQRS